MAESHPHATSTTRRRSLLSTTGRDLMESGGIRWTSIATHDFVLGASLPSCHAPPGGVPRPRRGARRITTRRTPSKHPSPSTHHTLIRASPACWDLQASSETGLLFRGLHHELSIAAVYKRPSGQVPRRDASSRNSPPICLAARANSQHAQCIMLSWPCLVLRTRGL